MRQVAVLLNEMAQAGVITDYALFGAVAQIRYTEPVATLAADVLVALPSPDAVDVPSPVYRYCGSKGLVPEGEGIRIGEWPVQFIPAFNALTREAMEKAEVADFEGVPLRVVSALHLAVIALSTGRAKDMARVLALLDAGAVSRADVAALAARHGLSNTWKRFTEKFHDE